MKYALRNVCSVGSMGNNRKQNHEFVSRQARKAWLLSLVLRAAQHVGPANTISDALGDLAQQLIGMVGTQCIVDLLETVDIDMQDRPGLFMTQGVS